MRPYFEQDGITVYHGDCRELLPHVGRFDLCLTDPPYGVGFEQKTSDFRGSDNFDDGDSTRASVLYGDAPEDIAALVREVIPVVLSISERTIVFSGTRMMWNYPEPQSVGCVFTPNGAGRNSWGFTCMHPILFYGKDPYLAAGKGSRPNSFRTEQPNREEIDHPCPKPIEWVMWGVQRGTLTGPVIDPFLGSGTTLVACKKLGIRGVGIEREEKYCEIAVKRILNTTPSLFSEASA